MIRAHVSEVHFGRELNVYILNENADTTDILRQSEERVFFWEPVNEAVTVDPTYTLGVLEARALLDGLSEHFKGASDVHQLKDALKRSEARVDRLVDGLLEVAQK